MAAKKVVKKAPAKKAVAKKVVKKVAKKVAAKPVPKAAAPVVKRGPGRPRKTDTAGFVKKPVSHTVASATKDSKPKAAKKDESNHYIHSRKWTLAKLEPLLEQTEAIRGQISSDGRGELKASELLEYLRLQENVVPEWKQKLNTTGVPRRRGRKPKGEKAQASAPPAVSNPKAVLAKGASGGLLKPRPAPAASAPKPAAPVIRKPVLIRRPVAQA